MPKIQFGNLPRPLWLHLLQRVDERRLSVADLLALQEWVKAVPVAPASNWYKDFNCFTLSGTDQLPRTVLATGRRPFGGSRKLCQQSRVPDCPCSMCKVTQFHRTPFRVTFWVTDDPFEDHSLPP